MDLKEVAHHRLNNQQLLGTKFKSATEMVTWFGAMQAQEYAQTKWGLGLRLPHLVDEDIEKEIEEGKILRTHLLRPTWHFVAAEDIYWILELTAPRVHKIGGTMYRKLGLDETIFNKSKDIIYKILEGDNHLTRKEIAESFEKQNIPSKGLELGIIMMHAELDGIICSGRRKGNQFTYALLEERVKNPIRLSKKEALAELTKRYFQSRGPATIHDFANWSGLTISDCRSGLSLSKQKFKSFQIENRTHYFLETDLKMNNPRVYLLPIYDEMVMGYKNRDAMMLYKNKIMPEPDFKYYSLVLYGGQVIGTYKRIIRNKKVDFEFDFFKLLDLEQKESLKEELNRFENFTKLTLGNLNIN